MINYLSSNLSVSIYQFSVTDVNATVKTYVWNGSLIVFVAWFNYLDQDFTSLDLTDAAGNNIVHGVSTHSNCYSIAFSGNSAGNPLETSPISNLNQIRFNFNISPVTTGYLIAKVYYI
jgi:hypothetical protein